MYSALQFLNKIALCHICDKRYNEIVLALFQSFFYFSLSSHLNVLD